MGGSRLAHFSSMRSLPGSIPIRGGGSRSVSLPSIYSNPGSPTTRIEKIDGDLTNDGFGYVGIRDTRTERARAVMARVQTLTRVLHQNNFS